MNKTMLNAAVPWHGGTPCTAFRGSRRVASGPLATVAAACRAAMDRHAAAAAAPLVFDDRTAELIEVDLRGTASDVVRRLPAEPAGDPSPGDDLPEAPPRGPGRPRLGVVAREVTLLPRHWTWLSAQPGGASVALRKLVENARRDGEAAGKQRMTRERCLRFITVMAGDRPGFEEATRALFAGHREQFEAMVQPWPADVRAHALRLADGAFAGVPSTDAVEGVSDGLRQ